MTFEASTDSIFIWQFPKGTTVNVEKSFIEELAKKRKLIFNSVEALYKSINPELTYSSFKNLLKASYPNFYDLHILLAVCKKLNIELNELQKNVVGYQFKKSRIKINNLVLPIKVTPLFPMIIAHMIADGCMGRSKSRSTLYFNYRQYDEEIRLLLLEKIRSLFGRIIYPNDYFANGTRIYLPEVVTLIFCDYYGMKDDSFLSKTALLPVKIMDGSKDELLAVLIAFIIDEGWIDSTNIGIGLKNEPLILQLSTICHKLGYQKTVCGTNESGMSQVYILRESIPKFWNDYCNLKATFPQASMGFKEVKIKQNLERFEKKWKSHGYNKTKNQIIQELKKGPAINWELSARLGITRQGIRSHTKVLTQQRILSTTKVKEGAYLYKLEKEITFSESKKGQSLPIGFTEKIIKEKLSVPKTTIELINEINTEKSTIRRILERLYKSGEITLIKKIPTRTMPTKLWQIAKNE